MRGAARWLAADITGALEDARACLRIKYALGALHTMAMSFDLVSACLLAGEDFERAAVLYGAADTLWTRLNAQAQMGPGYAELRAGGVDTTRARLGAERFEALTRRGRLLPLSAALAVATGEAAADPVPAAGSAAGNGTGPHGPQAKPLTRREKEIADLVAVGLGNKEIADRLFLSKRTVDSHIDHIFTKLHFSSRTQLVNWVLGPRKGTSS